MQVATSAFVLIKFLKSKSNIFFKILNIELWMTYHQMWM